MMIKYDEQHELDSVNGALAIRGEIERVVDATCEKGYDLICYMGIGGTYASALQVESHLKELSDLPVIVENAAQFNTTGNKRITEKSVVVISSVSGCTSEMVTAMLWQSGFALVLVWLTSIQSLVAIFTFICLLRNALLFCAWFPLHKKANYHPTFKAPGGPVMRSISSRNAVGERMEGWRFVTR